VDQGATLKPEAAGLRITIPANKARRHRAGIEIRSFIKGNFEMIAGYEILAADQPEAGYGVGFEMYLNAATPTQDRVGLFRLHRPVEGDSYMVGRGATVNGKPENKNTCFPTTARSGQLKLTRRGKEVIAWAAEGAAGPFKELHEVDFVAADLSRIWFAAYAGNTEYGVDLRIIDIKIRSNLPDNDPALVPAVAPVAAVAEEAPAAPKPGRTYVSLIVFGVFALTAAAALLVGVGIIVVRRRRSQNGSPSPRKR
jgi:hypothetical protein